ncbi:recombinase RecQ [Nocardioides silvaticus]|uniref:ATP-dependent DNA helicase RecQ n=1 Tax=Nocardioides silvaticus TaxID=2201891 RepID=A0A316TKG0_9ACTN|nr:RecQ family ATP-dependent DNA helicase [Nocardioides silvaticus]PWN02772.1 recombinase RecQ [Nocardioides silvaticus]
MTSARQIRDLARREFGHDSLLPGQSEAIGALANGEDVLLVSPTGAGKSLVYQVGGLLRGGCTIVVSPLLALQQDQVERIDAAPGEARAARLSSAEGEQERRDALAGAADGTIDFLFLSPEQLANAEVRARLAELRPGLVAVDEAHCVSVWGHDFRPDYFRLGELVAELGAQRIVAMTATAAPPVRDDIVERLGMNNARTVVTGFARPNLRLDVVRVESEDDQRDAVRAAVKDTDGAGIVYCRTRPAAEEYAALLAEDGRRTAVYHAGLGHRRRDEAYDAFMAGEVDTIVATSAFGMGIDKPDIRFVVHAQVPESPDTYYQEVGRAGRDGEPSVGTLVYRPEDLALGRFFSAGVPRADDVRSVVAAARAGDREPGAAAERTGLGKRKAGRILNLVRLVEEAGAATSPKRHTAAVIEVAEAHQRLERSRVDMMRGYAETDRCRAEFLVGYFGEQVDRCEVCDNCREGVAPETGGADAPYPVQSRVEHDEFGPGVVTDVEDDRLTVLFDDVGYRTLSLEVVEAEGLLATPEH